MQLNDGGRIYLDPGPRRGSRVSSAPKVLFERAYAAVGTTIPGYDISADGQRFVMVNLKPAPTGRNAAINWFEELKTRVPVTR